MMQLTQQLKSGQMEIVEVPAPRLNPGQVLVHNYYSVISAGTEGKTVSDARKGYIAKARSRQKEVLQVIDLIKAQGVKAAYDIVMNKLEALSPLGYSCAGKVIAVAPDITDIKVGDRVACGGATASHAEIIAVPKNLCVALSDNTSLKEAAFTTIASIALQGIRQADMQVGSKSVVIGLGLIGIITCKLLQSAGIQAFGIDVDADAVKRASEQFGINAAARSTPGIEEQVSNWTHGFGADSVIITAGTSSLDPINLAGELTRQKGKVIVVGAVPTGFDRKNYYRKELDMRMSCSYGPGRYDTHYEEQGIDYPIGYARWTERRNMQAIVELLAANQLSFTDLISHTYNLNDAPEAYSLIVEKKESFLGVLIQYSNQVNPSDSVTIKNNKNEAKIPNIGIIGSGSFAQNIMLPLLNKHANIAAIATSKGTSAVYTARKYKISLATTHVNQILEKDEINTIFIFTRHNLHATQAIETLKAGKHVFVEKPLCLTQKELEEIKLVYEQIKSPKPLLMVGFNRRFAPAVIELQKHINPSLPRAINIRINAGTLPSSHWVHDLTVGGGRIIGEGCHFIDLAIFLAGSAPESVYSSNMGTGDNTNDTANVNIKFLNGSIANISYFSNGNKRMPKEQIEVFCGSNVMRINDFKKVELYTGKSNKKISYKRSDKGHANEIKAFVEAVKHGYESPISFPEIYQSMQTTFLSLTSMNEKRVITYNH